MLKYRLIAADLDGTLLDSQNQISDYTKEMVCEYQNLGGLFTIATGRMEESARTYAKELNLKAPIIAFNGGKVVRLEDDAVLSEAFLEVTPAIETYNALRKLNKDMVIYLDGAPCVPEANDVAKKYVSRVGTKMRIIEDIKDIINPYTKKILVIDPKREFDLIRSTIAAIFGDKLNCVNSDAEFLEILPVGVSKGYGLEITAGSLGIPMSEVIAIGDHLNDISMIKAAGLGIAVQNAEEEVLAAADYITLSNDEDGVAMIIKKVIDGDLKQVL